MQGFWIEQLHQLRLRIFDNAEALHKEATLLFEHGHYARAYLLAHFACEELGKIPIVVGVIGRLIRGETVDWKKTMRRFRDHKAKIDSDDFHHYVFGIDLDLLGNKDLAWLEAATREARGRVIRKNQATYVDTLESGAASPLSSVAENHAKETLQRAFSSLRAHWYAERLTNPIVTAARRSRGQ